MSESIKNILFSVVAIAAVSLLAIGVTTAVWTTNATSTGNTFAAGDLSVELGNDTLGSGENVGAFFNASGLFPGDVESAYVEIANTSDEEIEFEAALTNASASGTQALDNVLELQVTHVLVGHTPDTGTLWNPGSWTADRIWIDFTDDNTIRDWRNGTLTDTDGSVEFANRNQALPAGQTAVYLVEVRVAEDAGNDYQGKSFTADLEVTAQRFGDE